MRTSYVTRRVIVYFGLKTGTRAYYRAAARVARYRRQQRLGREEYLRQERERLRRMRAYRTMLRGF